MKHNPNLEALNITLQHFSTINQKISYFNIFYSTILSIFPLHQFKLSPYCVRMCIQLKYPPIHFMHILFPQFIMYIEESFCHFFLCIRSNLQSSAFQTKSKKLLLELHQVMRGSFLRQLAVSLETITLQFFFVSYETIYISIHRFNFTFSYIYKGGSMVVYKVQFNQKIYINSLVSR